MSMIEETIVLGDSSDTFILDDDEESLILGETNLSEEIVFEIVGIAQPGLPGADGADGGVGPQGPPGDAVESLSREINQIFPEDPWIHYHNLTFNANGEFYDSTGETKLEPVRTERISGGMKIYWSDDGSRPIAGKAFYS